jgi:hypothetical protein
MRTLGRLKPRKNVCSLKKKMLFSPEGQGIAGSRQGQGIAGERLRNLDKGTTQRERSTHEQGNV